MAYAFGEELKLNYSVHSVIFELITSSCVLSALIDRWMTDDICLHLNTMLKHTEALRKDPLSQWGASSRKPEKKKKKKTNQTSTNPEAKPKLVF